MVGGTGALGSLGIGATLGGRDQGSFGVQNESTEANPGNPAPNTNPNPNTGTPNDQTPGGSTTPPGFAVPGVPPGRIDQGFQDFPGEDSQAPDAPNAPTSPPNNKSGRCSRTTWSLVIWRGVGRRRVRLNYSEVRPKYTEVAERISKVGIERACHGTSLSACRCDALPGALAARSGLRVHDST